MPGSAIVDLSTSYGAAFIGFIVSIALFGLTLGQTWMYFWHYWNSNDAKALKFFVVFITVMDTAHTAIFAYGLHWYLVQNFGNLEALAANTWFLDTQGNISGIYTTAVQLYYARQIYLLSGNIIPPIIIVVITASGNFIGVYIAVKVQVSLHNLAGKGWDERMRGGGRFDCCDDVLGSLLQEDWAREH